MFPTPDPIPLPAPVWLLKLLSLLTLGLHFGAVMILVGSLILTIYLNVKGRARQQVEYVQASYVLAKRLPVIMTYVINLGVPPLLFLQVLYGQQIYSSSVLIGSLWISVIIQLMLAYWLLYRTIHGIENRKPIWHIAGLSLLIVMGIGQIYSFNMTLMLRPEVWNEMYHNSPIGMQSPKGDPTITPRWLFVMAGGPLFGGLWAVLLSHMAYLGDAVKAILRRAGGLIAGLGGVLMLAMGYRVMSLQPAEVWAGIQGSQLHLYGLYAAGATIAVATLLGVAQGMGKARSLAVSNLGIVAALLATITSAIVRDGVRDFTLLQKGFDVNAVTVYPNWSVVIVFLLLFVIMLGVIYWLLNVMRQATPPKEEISI